MDCAYERRLRLYFLLKLVIKKLRAYRQYWDCFVLFIIVLCGACVFCVAVLFFFDIDIVIARRYCLYTDTKLKFDYHLCHFYVQNMMNQSICTNENGKQKHTELCHIHTRVRHPKIVSRKQRNHLYIRFLFSLKTFLRNTQLFNRTAASLKISKIRRALGARRSIRVNIFGGANAKSRNYLVSIVTFFSNQFHFDSLRCRLILIKCHAKRIQMNSTKSK